MVTDGEGCMTRSANDEIEKFGLNFSRFTDRDAVSLRGFI